MVVLSSAPGIADLSPTLLDLTDWVFQRKEAEVSSSKFSAVDGADVAGARPCQDNNVRLSARRTMSVRAGINASGGGVGAAAGRKDRAKKCETSPVRRDENGSFKYKGGWGCYKYHRILMEGYKNSLSQASHFSSPNYLIS